MADFCKQCSEAVLGLDSRDFRDINRLEHREVLCEGCGPNCVVDFTGECISNTCTKRHGLNAPAQDDIAMQELEIARIIGDEDSLHG